jgi:hypothetical protein
MMAGRLRALQGGVTAEDRGLQSATLGLSRHVPLGPACRQAGRGTYLGLARTLSITVPFVSIGLPALPAAASAAGGCDSWALFALRSALFALCSLLFALCSLLFALCSLLFALCSLLFALCSPLFALRSALCALRFRGGCYRLRPVLPLLREQSCAAWAPVIWYFRTGQKETLRRASICCPTCSLRGNARMCFEARRLERMPVLVCSASPRYV